MRMHRAIVSAFTILLAAGCSSATPAAQPLAPSVTPESTATSVINWFPETATPVAFASPPIRSPAAQAMPAGKVLLSDGFAADQRWEPFLSSPAAVTHQDDRLIIGAQPGAGSVASFLQGPIFSDFVLKVNVGLGLCSNADQYGVLFRAPARSAYYRFSVTCGGVSQVVKVKSGTTTVLRPATNTPGAPLGAPATLDLGIVANGNKLSFYINDHFQFEVQDTGYASGAIGLFAGAGGSTPVTVSFSDLVISAIAATSP